MLVSRNIHIAAPVERVFALMCDPAARTRLNPQATPLRVEIENDAWLVATAASLDADVVGADRAAFERLGARYLRFR